MPVVPFTPRSDRPPPLPEPDPVFVAIAAAMMQDPSQPAPTKDPSSGPTNRS